ncbi:DUF742 domain-containing protein [Streptomyces sp. bgisy153]|uniref:DUF742 domain-containing protein n=1 Tax=Streptomyces sp. bgisy153 TaxID=3413793 RepID=UPI003D742C16
MRRQERHPSLPPEAAETSFVRNYELVKGRTRPHHLLSLETVLERGSGRPGPGLPEESRLILALCAEQRRSVTELAGTIGRPVSTVKVLISDLLDARALVLPITATYTTSDDPKLGHRPTRQLLEALSAGLRNKWPDAAPFPQAG